jgi:hypothetical protein
MGAKGQKPTPKQKKQNKRLANQERSKKSGQYPCRKDKEKKAVKDQEEKKTKKGQI